MTEVKFRDDAIYVCANSKCEASINVYFKCIFYGAEINSGKAVKPDYCLAKNAILQFLRLAEPMKINYKYVVVNNHIEYKGKAYVTNDIETAMNKLKTLASYDMSIYEVVDKSMNNDGSTQALKRIYTYDSLTKKIEYNENSFLDTPLHIEWYMQYKEIIHI